MKTFKLFNLTLVSIVLGISTISCSQDDATINKETGEGRHQGHSFVDLGLSVKWATCNVGTSVPEDYGDYYAWGETDTKSSYNSSNNKWYYYDIHSYIKYCTDSYYGTIDNKTVLDQEDDVAHVKWGGDWRMPTYPEQSELRKNCTWTWTTQNGTTGYKVTSKLNGNSIFLPAAGYRSDSSLKRTGTYGCYWSASLCEESAVDAWYLDFDLGDVDRGCDVRSYGRSVRPVCP